MTKYKTSYKKDLESQVSWINSVVSDQFCALCTCVHCAIKFSKLIIVVSSLVNAHGKLNVILKLRNKEKVKGFLPFQVMYKYY